MTLRILVQKWQYKIKCWGQVLKWVGLVSRYTCISLAGTVSHLNQDKDNKKERKNVIKNNVLHVKYL